MRWLQTKLLLTGVLAVVMPISTFGYFKYVSAAPTISGLDYAISEKPESLSMAKGEKRMINIVVQNVSSATWDPEVVALRTVYTTGDLNRPSIWAGSGWTDNTKINWVEPGNVLAGKKATFSFELVAPEYSGWYKESFKLVADGYGELKGADLSLVIKVGSPVAIQSADGKEIVVYRSSQQSNLIENGYVVATLPISSGKSGYTTPAGTYHIFNHAEESYSQRYKLYMSNWMGLVREGGGYEGYGLHSLAYWKTTRPIYPDGTVKDGRLYVGNRVYEDAVHLGTPMSHGCVRYGINESGVVFSWAADGTKVVVM